MSEELRWNLSVQAVSGPTIAASGTLKMDAYNKLQVVVPARTGSTNGTLVVNIDTSAAELLFLQADQYIDPADPTKILGYAINPGATPPGATGVLTAPIFLIGADLIKFLGDPVTTIRFTNPINTPIVINLLIGGDVTP